MRQRGRDAADTGKIELKDEASVQPDARGYFNM